MRVIDAMDTLAGMKLASLDLNLLVALDALLRHRSVTRAAEELGLSQPAVSAQLARLRKHFHDDLLTRVGNAYRLTPLAVRLKEQVRGTLAGAERVFAAEPDFDPAGTTDEFAVLTSDYATAMLGPGLLALLAAEAPGARLRLIANTPSLVDAAAQVLINIDLMVMPHGFIEGMSHLDLYQDDWMCLVSADNTDVGESLTIAQLKTMPWVVTYHGPTASTPAERQMRTLGIEPHVQVVTEAFLPVPSLIEGTNRVALFQRRLADRIPAGIAVRMLPCPFEASPLIEAIWWHPMYDDDPRHVYLRNLFVRATAALE